MRLRRDDIKRTPVAAAPAAVIDPRPELDMILRKLDEIEAKEPVVLERVDERTVERVEVLEKKPKAWRFEVRRNYAGYIDSVDAYPIEDGS